MGVLKNINIFKEPYQLAHQQFFWGTLGMPPIEAGFRTPVAK
jgi:hypothetical protein